MSPTSVNTWQAGKQQFHLFGPQDLTGRSLDLVYALMTKNIMSPAIRNTPGQYIGIANHNEQQWQFNGIKEISKKYPRIEL